MDIKKYYGKGCKHGHHNEDGKSLRYISTRHCIECVKGVSRPDNYKEYQAEYHQMLRKEHPEKLAAYWKTQYDKGNHAHQKSKALKNATTIPAMNDSYVLVAPQDKGVK